MPFTDLECRRLFDYVDFGFTIIEVLFDEQGHPHDYRFIEVNEAFVAETGLARAVGRRMRELAPAHEQHWFDLYGQVALTGEPVRFEQQAAALGRWYSVFAARIGAPEDRRVAVLFSDITARKQALDDLRNSEARYRALVHATANSIFRFNADGTSLLELGGSSSSLPEGPVPFSDVEEQIHPDDRERVARDWAAAVREGRLYECEHRVRHEDSGWRWVLSRAVPLRNERGEVVEWIGAAADITARRHGEEALREREARHEMGRLEAELANRSKDEFLAMIAHELRNPLAPMVTALQVMRMRGFEGRELDVFERQIGHLTRLVEDLLDVGRITRGPAALRTERVELSAIVIRAMEIAGPIVEQRHQHVTLHVPRSGLCLDVDVHRMTQVVSNLVTNAAKYSHPGSHITIRGTRDGAIVRLTVTDEGFGIAPEMLESIFEPFVQQPQTAERSREGLGLGLAIVRTLVTAHGGTVRARSDGRDRGAELIVELPALVDGTGSVESCEHAGDG